MHPSFSIIFFTTASGAGFALLLLIGLGVPLGLLPANPGFGLAVFPAVTTALAAHGPAALWVPLAAATLLSAAAVPR